MLLPDFADEPVLAATVFVDAVQKDQLHYGDPNFSGLVFLLQSISIRSLESKKQIIVTAIWDQSHDHMTAQDKLWLSQWSVRCHLMATGNPARRVAKGSAKAKPAKSAKGAAKKTGAVKPRARVAR